MLSEAVMAGKRQGTIDPAAEDLAHQAEAVMRAVRQSDRAARATSSPTWSARCTN